MSTSILYHAWGIVGYDYQRTEYIDGKIIFHIDHKPDKLRCPCCRSQNIILRGTKPRNIRGIPVGHKEVWFALDVQRIECLDCLHLGQVRLGFADPHVSYSRGFERHVLELLQMTTISDVALHLQISWDVIKGIQKRNLQKRFGKINLKNVQRLAIDEIAVQKGHRYLTVVMDLDSGAVVFVGDGKGADALLPFWIQLKKSRAVIEAVAADMSEAYGSAVRENIPDAVLVLDHFHVVKAFQEKLTELRRDLYSKATEAEKSVLKGSRWLLLKNPENLDPTRKEKERLEEALLLNKPLAIAYYLKEDLRSIWSQDSKENADKEISAWIEKAEASGIHQLKAFAKTLANHRKGILSYYDFRISTGPLEGMNNKIKTMKRQAYGFRDMEFFKLRILAIHEAKHVFVG